MDKRDTCIFYRSIFESIQELSKEQQADIYNAVFEYSLNFNETELSGISKTIFNLVKPVLAANNSRYINGSQPKINKYGKQKAKQKQDLSETDIEKKQNNSEEKAYKYKNKYNYKNWTIEEFISSIKENGTDYDSKMLNDFYNHWSEKDSNGKMKLQLEKTWETNKRLSTWKKRSDQWSGNKSNKITEEQKSRSERGVKY